jgi:hypothetical protein
LSSTRDDANVVDGQLYSSEYFFIVEKDNRDAISEIARQRREGFNDARRRG